MLLAVVSVVFFTTLLVFAVIGMRKRARKNQRKRLALEISDLEEEYGGGCSDCDHFDNDDDDKDYDEEEDEDEDEEEAGYRERAKPEPEADKIWYENGYYHFKYNGKVYANKNELSRFMEDLSYIKDEWFCAETGKNIREVKGLPNPRFLSDFESIFHKEKAAKILKEYQKKMKISETKTSEPCLFGSSSDLHRMELESKKKNLTTDEGDGAPKFREGFTNLPWYIDGKKIEVNKDE